MAYKNIYRIVETTDAERYPHPATNYATLEEALERLERMRSTYSYVGRTFELETRRISEWKPVNGA